jgi:hypothetical protein
MGVKPEGKNLSGGFTAYIRLEVNICKVSPYLTGNTLRLHNNGTYKYIVGKINTRHFNVKSSGKYCCGWFNRLLTSSHRVLLEHVNDYLSGLKLIISK